MTAGQTKRTGLAVSADRTTSEHSPMNRLPLRSVLAAYLHSLPSIAGSVGVVAIVIARPDTWLGQWVLIPVALFLLVRFIHPVVAWRTMRYQLTPEHLVVEQGVWVRRRTVATWDTVSVRDQSQPWAYRPFALFVVVLHTGGEITEDGSIEFAGVDGNTADALLRTGLAAATADSDYHEPAQHTIHPDLPSSRNDALLYRATAPELLIAGLAQGRVFVAGVAGIFGLLGVLEFFGLDDFGAYLGLGLPLLMAITVSIILGLGMMLTLLRFHGFEVRQHDGQTTISYGLLEKHERTVQKSALVGFRVHRNLVEMSLDRVRILLLAQDSTAGRGANVTLPSLPRPVARALLEPWDDEKLSSLMLQRSGIRSLPTSALAVIVVVGVCAGGAWLLASVAQVPLIVPVAGALLLFAVTLWFGRLASMRILTRGAAVRGTQHHLFERHDIVQLPGLHLVTETAVASSRSRLLGIHYFAGAPRVIRGFVRGTEQTDLLASSLAAAASDLARSRNRISNPLSKTGRASID